MRLSPELLVLAVSTLLIAGCGETPATPNGINQPAPSDLTSPDAPSSAQTSPEADSLKKAVTDSKPSGKPSKDPADIAFKDDVRTNVEIPQGLNELFFTDMNGSRVNLEDYLGSKNVVLVFTEGFAGGMLCPFCKTQTARLVANYDQFKALNTEIMVVYPGSPDHLQEFIRAATHTEKDEVGRVPFPLLLDQQMKAVGFFNIASNLAHPSTFIIDRKGNIRLAYVGADMTADRPSVAAMLKIIREAEKSVTLESSDAESGEPQ